jgi:hypothetical protein
MEAQCKTTAVTCALLTLNSLFCFSIGVGKSFWHPNVSRLEAEQLLKTKPPGSFVMRRSSKVRKQKEKKIFKSKKSKGKKIDSSLIAAPNVQVGCLALSHKLPNHSYGHALVMFDGQGYMLEQVGRILRIGCASNRLTTKQIFFFFFFFLSSKFRPIERMHALSSFSSRWICD